MIWLPTNWVALSCLSLFGMGLLLVIWLHTTSYSLSGPAMPSSSWNGITSSFSTSFSWSDNVMPSSLLEQYASSDLISYSLSGAHYTILNFWNWMACSASTSYSLSTIWVALSSRWFDSIWLPTVWVAPSSHPHFAMGLLPVFRLPTVWAAKSGHPHFRKSCFQWFNFLQFASSDSTSFSFECHCNAIFIFGKVLLPAIWSPTVWVTHYHAILIFWQQFASSAPTSYSLSVGDTSKSQPGLESTVNLLGMGAPPSPTPV